MVEMLTQEEVHMEISLIIMEEEVEEEEEELEED
jgi:hypothetical protein